MRRDSRGRARGRTRRRGRPADPRRTAVVERDRGATLTELLVTIVVMGIIITPVMNSVMGVIKASATNRGLSQVETVLTNAADQVNRAPKSCDYTIYAQYAAQVGGWQDTDAWVTQRHYQPGATPADPGTWVDGACQGGQPDDLLVQLVEITVRNPDTGAQRTIQVVKSDV